MLRVVENKIISLFKKKMMLLEEQNKIDDVKDEDISSEYTIETIYDESGNYLIEKTQDCIIYNSGNRFITPYLKEMVLRLVSIVDTGQENFRKWLDDDRKQLKQMAPERNGNFREERLQIIDFFINR